MYWQHQRSNVTTEEKNKFSNLIEQSKRKVEPFETIIGEIGVTIIAVIIADTLITTLLLPRLPNMLLSIYVHISTFLSAFGVLYAYRLSRHLQIIKEVDNFLKSAGRAVTRRCFIIEGISAIVLPRFFDTSCMLLIRELVKSLIGIVHPISEQLPVIDG